MTKETRNKIVRKLTRCYFGKTLERLTDMIYAGVINFQDTFNKSFNEFDDADIDFIISSAEGCLGSADLTNKEREIFDKMSLAK